MPITVKHSKVSTIPDTDDTSLVRPSDWNADHTLIGLGTMAEQDANNVNITGGSITGVSGIGDVTGPASATDNAVARFDATTGKLIQNSVVTVSDTGAVTGITTLSASTSVTTPIVKASNSAGGALQNSSGTNQIQFGAGGGNNISLDVATNINPLNAQVDISPTGTGTVRINPTTAGTINNMSIGATTPSTVNATTITGQTGRLNGTGQNLFVRSNTFNTTWSLSSVTLTSGQSDPFGGSNAWLFTSTGGTVGASQSPTLGTATHTFSIYAKAGNSNWLRVIGPGTSNSSAWFNLSTGVIGTIQSNVISATITSVGSGWYRCAIVSVGSGTCAIRLVDNDNVTSSSNGNTLLIYGAQLELASNVGTYLDTTTTAVYGTPTLSFSGVSTIGLESNGALYLQPAGTGAIQAQATTSTTAGGNARGANAVDWQTLRTSAGQVASATLSAIGGGTQNTASSFNATVAGGATNLAQGNYNFIGGGQNNTANGNFLQTYSVIAGGRANTANGYHNFIGAGFTNSGTSITAVTTQSATMNGTTAVTLSGSNASIRVGQFITGTSIADQTYVAAISGTSLTLSQAASGSSTSTLSFFTPHGVVVGGGNNQATGAYSFIGGGGDAGTAANRNTASGDYSVVVGGRSNIASGIGAFVGGGGFFGDQTTYPNTASGIASAIGGGIANTASGTGTSIQGGFNNTANGTYSSVLGGAYATTRSIAGNAVASGSNAPIATTVGVSQFATLVLGTQTTDATATALRSNTAAAGTTNQVILPNNSAYFFRGEVVSGVTGGGNTKGWTIEGVIKRGANAASTALVGTPTVTSSFADAGASTWTIAVTADTTNGGLRVTFTGQASTTIRTVCQIRTTEMTY